MHFENIVCQMSIQYKIIQNFDTLNRLVVDISTVKLDASEGINGANADIFLCMAYMIHSPIIQHVSVFANSMFLFCSNDLANPLWQQDPHLYNNSTEYRISPQYVLITSHSGVVIFMIKLDYISMHKMHIIMMLWQKTLYALLDFVRWIRSQMVHHGELKAATSHEHHGVANHRQLHWFFVSLIWLTLIFPQVSPLWGVSTVASMFVAITL